MTRPDVRPGDLPRSLRLALVVWSKAKPVDTVFRVIRLNRVRRPGLRSVEAFARRHGRDPVELKKEFVAWWDSRPTADTALLYLERHC